MKALHKCPPLLVGDQVYVLTYQHGVVPARICMVLQKSDRSWLFRASYKCKGETRQKNFTQEQLNESEVFLLEEYAKEALEDFP